MKRLPLRDFVNYMQDALKRFHVRQERAGATEDSFDFWWRRLHHHVRAERPRAPGPPPGTRCDPTITRAPPRRPRGGGG